MNTRKPPPIFYLLRGLCMGIGANAISALFLASASDHGFWTVFFVLFVGTIMAGAIILVWLTRWAMRDDGRVSQFGIGTLLMLTGLAAIYLGFVRWLVEISDPLKNADYTSKFVGVCIVSLILLAFSLIPLLSMAESLVWLATLVVRWKPVRRVLFGRNSQKDAHWDD